MAKADLGRGLLPLVKYEWASEARMNLNPVGKES